MRMTLAMAVACLAIGGICTAHDADAAIRHPTDIPPQPLAPALQTLVKQRDIQLVYRAELISDRKTDGAVGEFTAVEALGKLLDGTGLTYQFLDEKTITIIPVPSGGSTPPSDAVVRPRAAAEAAHSSSDEVSTEKANPPAAVEKRSFWDRFRLAQVDTQKIASDGRVEGTSSASSAGPVKLEEVIVTAQKREERLQDVPIAISVLSGDDLDKSTVRDAGEALSQVPGVTVNQVAAGATGQIAIRGVSLGQMINGGGGTTAYYLDTVPFGFVKTSVAPDPNVYDLDRIEVLRGPQGTLYGANALNGVVRVLTKDANLDEAEFKARALTSSTEQGGWNYRADLAANMPIVEGKLAARAVVGYQNLSGWIDKPNANEKDANDAEIRTARLKINAQPTDQLSIGAFAWLTRADYGATALGSADGTNTFSTIPEPTSNDTDAYGVKIGYAFSGFDLTSMTSYLEYELHSVLSSPFPFDDLIKADTFSQEVVLNSTGGGHWRWTAGGMYRDSKDRRIVSFVGIVPAPSSLANLSESYAAFGELTRVFLNGELELTGGLRYFSDDVGLREYSALAFVQPPQYANLNAKFSATTPRAVLTWHPSNQLTAYVSYGEGFRSGAHQVPASAILPPLKPDTLRNYEVGTKAGLLNGRLKLDAAVYYIDWKDVQRVVLMPVNGVNFTGLVNGTSASGVGVDLGITLLAVDGLSMGVSYGWNDLTVDSDVFSGGSRLFAKGDRIDYSPKSTIGAFADYTFNLGGGGFQGRLSASANYTSVQQQRTLLPGGVVQVAEGDEMTIARASFSVISPRGWDFILFADNITDEDGTPVAANPVDRSVRIRPRTIGVQLDYRF